MFAYGNGDEEATLAYYRALGGDMPLDEDVLQAYAPESRIYATPTARRTDSTKTNSSYSLTLRNIPNSKEGDKVSMAKLSNDEGAYMWQTQYNAVVALADKIDVWYESPRPRLLQDPQSKP